MNEHSTTPGQSSDLPEAGEGKKPGLPRPPLYTTDYIAMAEALEFMMERFGKLVLAIMHYTASGTAPNNLPPDLKLMFSIYQKRIDSAREKYEKKCAANAENGAKGGKAKAENAKKKTAGVKFTPPTQKQFREAVQHFADDGDIADDIGDYDADSFFDELKDAGWTINGEPIRGRRDWESAIRAKFEAHVPHGIPQTWSYLIFAEIFTSSHGLRDHEGASRVEAAESDFFDTYDKASKSWVVQGKQFHIAAWKEALALFMEQYSESGET